MFIVCNADQTGATEPGGGGQWGSAPPPPFSKCEKVPIFRNESGIELIG